MKSDNSVSKYITGLYAIEDPVLKTVRENTPLKGLPAIHIRPEEGHFLQVLVRASMAKNVLEIGTLGGYSGIWIARGLVSDGKLTTLELDPHHAAVAREPFALAGLLDQVEIKIGDAHQSLIDLSTQEPFDFVFIDAEKPGYTDYFIWCMTNVAQNGVITAHNVLRRGDVADPDNQEERVLMMREFNQIVADEGRVISTIYPAGDGLLVAVKVS